MKTLIMGVSSEIGRDMIRALVAMDIDLILVTKGGDRPHELKRELAVSVDTVILGVSTKENCPTLYRHFRNDSVDTLINNAGFGNFGKFTQTDLDKKLNMISINIQAVHILNRPFLRGFIKKNRGYILNAASSTTFLPGPLMTIYCTTKVHIEYLTPAMHRELQRRNSHASTDALCPGSMQIEPDRVASVRFMTRGKTSMDVASYAVRGMSKEEAVMISGALMKGSHLLCKCLPLSVQVEASYHIQHRKNRQTSACISK